MASINYAAREISVKIVYYGPGLSGKTTNLQVIHRKVPQEYKSDMVSLATETDRTLFFDFLPLDLGKIKGFATKFQLYTVPGQVYYNATRKLVLRGVDGVVFVADSAPDKMQENIESFQNLEDNLAEYGYKRENIPIIIQYNKRDLPNALPVEEMQLVLNKYNLACSEAIANKGKGVFDSLKLIGKIVIDYLNKKYSRPSRSGSMREVPNQSSVSSPRNKMMPQQQQMGRRPPMPNMRPGQQQQPIRPRQPMQQQMGPGRQQPIRPAQQQMRPRQPIQQMNPQQQQMQQMRSATPQQMTPPKQPMRQPRQPMQQMGQQQQMRPPKQPMQPKMRPGQQYPPQNIPGQNSFRQPNTQQNSQFRQQFPRQQYSGRNLADYQQPDSGFPPTDNNFQPPYSEQHPQFPPKTPGYQGYNQSQQFTPAENDADYNQNQPEPNQNFDGSFESYSHYQQNTESSYPSSDIQEDYIETFEPQDDYSNKAVSDESGQEMDYYDYGSINLQPMSSPQDNASNTNPPQTDYSPEQQANSFETSGKTDLDMEIEKYQREIEEKQRMTRSKSPEQGSSGFQNAPYKQQDQKSFDAEDPYMNQQQYVQNTDEDDYDVYNLEVSFPPDNQTSSDKQINTPVEDSDDMYFTSIDTDRQKKPVRRPVNPRTQQQKGFLSKFFNKDAP